MFHFGINVLCIFVHSFNFRLLANYVYCPRHRNAKVSSRLLLNRAIKNFGPMTQKALGYIMYHAFPGVERVKDTRRGHIFKGILDKKDLSVSMVSVFHFTN
jgi:hypothetical protein